ncbi:MAG TPA: hypothetical protein VFB45_22245 [Pseudolabrys sp.]|nr:hypothetical protein [Pseudolabrys sp.]
MPRRRELHDELRDLHAEIGRSSDIIKATQDDADAEQATNELKNLLKQLQAAVTDTAGHLTTEAEEAITAHPIAGAAAAFALGIIVGRTWTRI